MSSNLSFGRLTKSSRIGFDSVQAADISLCVLPLPEIRPHSKDIRLGLAPEIQELIDEKTVFLFNKADLVSGASQNTHSTTGTEWQVSLSTGQGCKAFLSGFEKILQERYGIVTLSSPC